SERGTLREAHWNPATAPASYVPLFDLALLLEMGRWLAFPELAVRAGDSWASPESGPGPDRRRATTRVLRLEGTNGSQLASLRHSFSLPLKTAQSPWEGRAAGDLTVRFDVTAGHVVSATGSLDFAVTRGREARLGPVMRLEVRVQRLQDNTPASRALP
ncbi:MAG: hypothetical protein QHJ73_19995, partial [Armatimonadota bacterium]|nr:hypothetical protein [Armatimonadota bacterium]